MLWEGGPYRELAVMGRWLLWSSCRQGKVACDYEEMAAVVRGPLRCMRWYMIYFYCAKIYFWCYLNPLFFCSNSEDCERCGEYVRHVFSFVLGALAAICLLIVLLFEASQRICKRLRNDGEVQLFLIVSSQYITVQYNYNAIRYLVVN